MNCKKLHFLLLVFGLLFFQQTSVQGQIALDWLQRDVIPVNSIGPEMGTNNITEGTEDAGVDVDLDAFGNVYSVNYYAEEGSDADPDERISTAIYKTDIHGRTVWKYSIEGILNGSTYVDVQPGGIKVTNNAVYVIGYNYNRTLNVSEGAVGYRFQTNGGDTTINISSVGGTGSGINTASDRIKGFVAKYDLNGNFIWANFIVSRAYTTTNPGTLSEDMGRFVINDLDVDDLGNVYIVGQYNKDSLQFCNDSCTAKPPIPINPVDTVADEFSAKVFYAKYFSTGQFAWTSHAQFAKSGVGSAIAVEGTNVYIGGQGTGDLISVSTLDSPRTSPLTINDRHHIRSYNNIDNGSFDPKTDFRSYGFIFRVKAEDAEVTWTGKLGGNNNEAVRDIEINSGNIFVALNASVVSGNRGDSTYFRTSTFSNNISFEREIGDSSSGAAYLLRLYRTTPIKSSNARLDKMLAVDEIQGFESEDYPIEMGIGSCLSSDDDGNVYMVVTQNSTCIYYPRKLPTSGTASSTSNPIANTVSTLSEDILIAKYDGDGFDMDVEYVKEIGNTDSEFGTACAANLEQLIVTGRFIGTSDFEPNPAITNSLSSYGIFDCFVAQYACFKPRLVTRNETFCENDVVQLEALARCPSGVCNYSYEWIDPAAGSSFSTSSNQYSFSGALGTNNRIVEMTDVSTGCVSSDTIDVLIQPRVTISNTVNPSGPLCKGTPFTFSVSAGGQSGLNYSWFPTNDTSNILGTSSSFTTSVTGSYNVKVEKAGCSDIDVVVLNNYAEVSPLIIPENPLLCGGGSVLEVIDCPGCNYVWRVPPGSSASSTSNTIVADVAGRYIVDLTDANGCAYEREVDVVNQSFLNTPIVARDASGTALNSICNGRPLTLSTTSPIACPTCTYLWNDSTTGPYNFAYSPGTYNVTVTNTATGCIGVSSSLNIISSTLVPPVITGDPGKICTGSNIDSKLKIENPCTLCEYTWYQNTPTQTIATNAGGLNQGQLTYQPVVEDDFYVRTKGPNGCIEYSNIITVGREATSKPPINTTSKNLCGNNSVTLSTVDCANCEYEWFYEDNQSLMITGVYSGGQSGEPKGIELYATVAISDLSEYMIGTISNGGGLPPGNTFTFPAVSIAAGQYIHIANNTTTFQTHFGFAPDYTSAVALINGNDAILLYQDSAVIDVMGDTINNPSLGNNPTTWGYEEGWIYRNNNALPSGRFIPGQWRRSPINALDTCINNTACGNPVPIQTFSTTNSSSFVKRQIQGADTSILTTNIPRNYSVKVKYPNSCYRESNTITIDTASFEPVILGQTPRIPELIKQTSLFYSSRDSVRGDTVYSCNGRSVDIFMTGTVARPGVFASPPIWTYQWLYNGTVIVGETGTSITVDSVGIYTVAVTNDEGCTSISNPVHVILSTTGANPNVVATPNILCQGSGLDTATLTTLSCPTCAYLWQTESNDNATVSGAADNIKKVGIARGYFVITTDSNTFCSYASPIVEISDTLFPAPTITAVSNPVCATGTVNLQTSSCSNCAYIWEKEDTTGGATSWNQIDSVFQNIYAIDSSGKYRMKIVNYGSCETKYSNIIQATFQDINAAIDPPTVTSICNGNTDVITAVPDAASCPGCVYEFFRDGIKMQPDTLGRDSQTITQGGSYTVAITNQNGCTDTSNAVVYQDVIVGTSIRQSTGKICGPTACVDLEIDRCNGCTYQWFLGNVQLSSQDTIVTACGYTSAGTYRVEVSSGGCVIRDTVELDTAPELIVNIRIDSLSNTVICGNTPVVMQDVCDTCGLSTQSYQWIKDGNLISGAGFESYSADSAGAYQLEVVDTNNCREQSNTITLQRFDSDTTFALDFSSLGAAIPFTYGQFHLDSFLTPASLRTNATGVYSSLTADPAIGGVNNDSLNPVTAGSGLHVITFEYSTGGCTFSTSDTLEILDPMSMSIENQDTSAPVNETCIQDRLTVNLTNFTFIPDSILFVTDNNNTIAVAVNPSVTVFAGVYTGTINVRVPIGARTGKIELKDNGSNSFFSPNFLVVQNPAVAINLVGVTQPLCSHTDSTELVGIPATPDPARGLFEAHYVGQPSLPELITDTNYLNVDTITGYNNMGYRDVYVVYQYIPTYSNGQGTCPAVRDSILVEVRNSELDRVVYSPISETQASENMDNLRRITYPFGAMGYTHNYTGTYVLANNILPANAPTLGNQSVTYEMNNGGCVNTSEDSVNIWPAPAILDSIPNFLCRAGDTICIERSLDSLIITYRGNVIYEDTLYRYQPNNQTFGTDITYNEQLNIMEIYSSNGGLDSLNFVLPSPGVPQKFNLVASNVTGNNTRLTFRFRNRRLTTYLNALPVPFTDTIDYVVAEVQKVVNIETPPTVAISPVILADTNFCPINLPVQMSGLPVGGTFYFGNKGGGPVAYDTLANNIFNAVDYSNAYGNSFDLVYVYEGQACIDSASTGVYIPDTFSIAIDAIGRYCATSEEDSVSFTLPYAPPSTIDIDTSSAQFFVRGVLSVPVFDPLQNYPTGSDTIESYPVEYVVSDIYGCEESVQDTFEIYPLPDLAINFPLDTQLCLNVPGTALDLQVQYVDANSYTSVISNTARADSFTMKGAGILNGGLNPANPFFEPDSAGVGIHILSYTYTDTIGCTDSLNMRVEILPLPVVALTTVGGTALESEYCENDTVVLVGSPQSVNTLYYGYGYHTDNDTSQARIDTISNSLHLYTPNIRGTEPGVINDTLFYWFENASTGCRDTALNPVLLRNFTTDPTIVGYPIDTCASNYEVNVSLNLNGGLSLDSLGYFESPDSTGFSMPNPAVGTTVLFYPDSSNVKYASRNVILNYHYTDTSGTCNKSISDTCFVHALPELTLSEDLYPNINPLGSKLVAPNTDTLNHVCERRSPLPIYAYNQTGYYVGSQLVLYAPDHISPDTGTYNVSQSGVAPDANLGSRLYVYYPNTVQGGADTIEYTYTDSIGCTDSLQYVIVVDTIPDLDFVGLINYNPAIDKYVYCEKEPTPPIITPSPDGIAGSELLFNNNPVNTPFQLRPDTLAIPNTYVNYPLDYHYVGQRYVAGGTCADTLSDTIQIRPAPQLSWSLSIPDHFCVRDSQERIPLSAAPTGGIFVDYTFGVIAGIVADTLFNPTAQAGIRNIYYQYTDPTSGCTDSIQKRIEVYTLPKIGFDVEGGCQGRQIDFIPEVEGIEYNGVAIDSLTLVIWDFGDGVVDTISYLPDTLVVPQDTHTYAGTGIFYPSLTVWNQGKCDTTFTRRVIISPHKTPTVFVPYEEDFDASPGGWYQAASDTSSLNGIVNDSLWQWGIAKGQKLNTTDGNGGGDFVWGTRILDPLAVNNTYRQGENAWVYSPCFDLTGLDRPMIELSIMRDMEQTIDGAVLQYYDDATQEWTVLGKPNKGINWYQDGFIVSFPGEQTGTPIGWTHELAQPVWENARYRLDNIGNDLRTRTDVRFRIAFASDPQTLQNTNEGFLFDDVRIGNRTRNVLVEHFSGVGYTGIEAIEDQLYHTLFNGLYGRDVHLVQYHTELTKDDNIPGLERDPRYRHTPDTKDAIDNRIFIYRVSDNNQVRINGGTGSNAVSQTSALLNYPELEVLDIEALKDPVFDLKFAAPNGGYYIDPTTGTVTATIDITANEYFEDSLMLRVALTEDSVETTRSHLAKGVLRYMLPQNVGEGYTGVWNVGDQRTYSLVEYIDPTTVVPSRTEIVVFMQDLATREVYQVISSRNITQWIGAPVDTLDVSVDNLPNLQEWEVINMKLYPNPAQDYFTVEFTQPLEGDYDWQLIDAVGRIIQTGQAAQGIENMQVQTNELASGMYIFTMKNHNVYTQRKVIVRRP